MEISIKLMFLLFVCFGVFFDLEACGILASQPQIKPALPASEGNVLPTGLPEKSLSET